MRWKLRGAVAVVAVAALFLAGTAPCSAQVVVAAPQVSYYYAPPVVSYYTPPVVSYYAAPVVSYYAAPAVTYYPATTVTTYRYGILPRRAVTVTTYGAPVVRY
jgi:hypothetical protein